MSIDPRWPGSFTPARQLQEQTIGGMSSEQRTADQPPPSPKRRRTGPKTDYKFDPMSDVETTVHDFRQTVDNAFNPGSSREGNPPEAGSINTSSPSKSRVRLAADPNDFPDAEDDVVPNTSLVLLYRRYHILFQGRT